MLASDDDPALAREAKWLDDQTLADGSKADAYEVRLAGSTPELESQRFVEGLLFGTSGMRGYVRPLSDAVVITFAQRPAVLTQACDSAQQASASPQSGFASSPAVRVIRQWMPAQLDVEVYLGAAQIILVFNFVLSLRRGKLAGNNPWHATTLEWQTASPPPHENFTGRIPTVYRGPYEYSVPGHGSDYSPQNEVPAGAPPSSAGTSPSTRAHG